MHLKKRMRTVVITRSIIKKIFLVFLCIFMIIIFGIVAKGILKLPIPTGEVGIGIISKNINDNKTTLQKVMESILGFDLRDKKTIFYEYYAMFGEIDNAEAAIESSPPEWESELINEEQNSETEKIVTEPKVEAIKVSKGMVISNLAKKDVNADELANEPLHINLDDNGPQVLIIHTHTTESFVGSADNGDRSTDNNKNMVAVGEVIRNILEEEGIKTVHDTTVHDYPSYNGAYTRSMKTVKSNLEKYPSIKVVLDVHRDGIIRDDGTKVKVVCDVNGEKAAQCMFVIGSDSKLTHKNWRDNMRLACKLQKYANENYCDLMRPIILRKERFNQQVSTGAIIIEVGSNGNTIEEAKTGAKYIAKTLGAVLK